MLPDGATSPSVSSAEYEDRPCARGIVRAKYPRCLPKGTLAPVRHAVQDILRAYANPEHGRSRASAPFEREAGPALGAIGQAAGSAGRAKVVVSPGPDRTAAAARRTGSAIAR